MRGPIVHSHAVIARVPRSSRLLSIGGFTLIELMVVVAIIAILAAIAYPSYQDSVRKSRRGQAKADLVELAQHLERFHTVNNTYETPATWPNPVTQSPKTGTAHYEIEISNQTATGFLLTAEPLGAQTKDTRCMSLTLTAAGEKDIVGGSGTAEDC